jgi:hypothetical protein
MARRLGGTNTGQAKFRLLQADPRAMRCEAANFCRKRVNASIEAVYVASRAPARLIIAGYLCLCPSVTSLGCLCLKV